MLVASRLYPRLPDDVDPAHPLAALTPDKLYTLPDSPHAARLRELADQEITQLLRRAGDDLALDVLGLLTAARGGPLSDADLAALTGSRPWKVRGVLDGEAARTLQQVGPADTPRYTFAHETLLARCQQQGVGDPGHTRRIEEWAATWRDRGWPAAHDGEQGTPLYLLDRYPRTLYGDPPRLAALAGDVGWVTAAIRTLGVDAVLAELKTAGAAARGGPRLAAMHAVVRGQAHHLRGREAVGDPKNDEGDQFGHRFSILQRRDRKYRYEFVSKFFTDKLEKYEWLKNQVKSHKRTVDDYIQRNLEI